MFGVLRTVLALLVVAQHLWLRGGHPGIYAVFGFYIISGYLMTLIMHHGYGYSSQGRSAFLLNRFLRIYPQYWLALLVSVVLIVGVGTDAALSYHGQMYLPEDIVQWLKNGLLLFLSWRPVEVTPMLAPAAWALTVELFYYLLICLGISKTFKRVVIWFIASIVFVAMTYLLDWPWQDRYYPLAAGSLPFCIGSAIYFLSQRKPATQNERVANRLFILLLLNAIFWCILRMSGVLALAEIGFYLNLLICSGLIYCLAQGQHLFTWQTRFDKTIGDYSYPIYLLHWQVGLLSSWLVFGEPFNEFSLRGFLNFGISCVVLIPLCWLSLRLVDDPVQRVRKWIKRRQSDFWTQEPA